MPRYSIGSFIYREPGNEAMLYNVAFIRSLDDLSEAISNNQEFLILDERLRADLVDWIVNAPKVDFAERKLSPAEKVNLALEVVSPIFGPIQGALISYLERRNHKITKNNKNVMPEYQSGPLFSLTEQYDYRSMTDFGDSWAIVAIRKDSLRDLLRR